jgi:hypothetical protein
VRIMGMVGDAEAIYTDPAVVAATRAALDLPVAGTPGPTRAELEAALTG